VKRWLEELAGRCLWRPDVVDTISDQGHDAFDGLLVSLAIMFEALFILTTVDTGTRVARYILQEILKPIHPKLGSSTWLPGVVFSSAAISFLWGFWCTMVTFPRSGLCSGWLTSYWPLWRCRLALFTS